MCTAGATAFLERLAEQPGATVDDLRQLCGEGRARGLEDHCRELASFAARFDECGGECEVLVRRELAPVPSR